MPKSRTRRTTPRRRPTTPARRSQIDLTRGVVGPAGVRIRLARPADLEAVQRLLPLADPSLGEDGTIMLEHPLLATGLQRALRHGRPALFTGAPTRDLYGLTLGLSVLLVAVDQADTVVGVLMALPPVRILGQFLQAGVPLAEILLAAQTVVKLKGVAVDEKARGNGIGTALINLCVQLYTELGWSAIYGQFDKKNRTLQDYYTRLGFTVLAPREGAYFSDLLPFPLHTLPLGGERIFVRRTSNAIAADGDQKASR